MKNTEADQILKRLGKSRKWLAEQSGYKVTTLYNNLNGEETELTSRMSDALQRAFDAEENKIAHPFNQASGLWDSVQFTASEIFKIEEARKVSAHETFQDFLHDSAIWYADNLLAEETEQQSDIAAEDPPEPFGHKPNGDVSKSG